MAQFYEKENLNCSSTLIPLLKKRLISRDSFCVYLSQRQFTKSVYPRNGRLKAVGHELKSIFLRWKEYTQVFQVFLSIFIFTTGFDHA
jgi:hypothetical protein